MSATSPLPPEGWNPVKARHLLNRAGFGVPDSLVDQLSAMTPEAAVNYLVDFEGIPFHFPEPDFLLDPVYPGKLRKEMSDLGEVDLKLLIQEQQKAERLAIETLKTWWLGRMSATPRPLEEKMTLFWHGHFAVSAQKVKYSKIVYEYFNILNKNALGNFKTLCTAIGQSSAMLDYLDNKKSTKEHPNENWARELMELFTLGQGQYTEDDIKESARAFTGWSSNDDGFEYRISEHDFGNKTFLGRTGNFDGWNIVNIIFEQPAAAEFICGKLWKFFASETPDAAVISELAESLRENKYEVKPVLKRLFLSEAFYQGAVMGTQVKSPAHLTVQLAHHLDFDSPPCQDMAFALRGLGQDLFYPPNVKGWDGNRVWINANSMLMRCNLPMQLLNSARKEQNSAMNMVAAEGGEAMMAPEGGEAKPAPKMEKPGEAVNLEKQVIKESKEAVREALDKLEPKKRREYRLLLKEATPEDRRRIALELGVRPPVDTDALEPLFAELDFTTVGDCIYQIASRLLVPPISHEQRNALIQAIGHSDVDTPLSPIELSGENRRALIHLITSLAEYQLC